MTSSTRQTAISRPRVDARASRSPATFAQAISSTSPISTSRLSAPARRRSSNIGWVDTSPVGVTVTPSPSFESVMRGLEATLPPVQVVGGAAGGFAVPEASLDQHPVKAATLESGGPGRGLSAVHHRRLDVVDPGHRHPERGREDGRRHASEAPGRLGVELPAPLRRQRVVLRPPVVLGCSPRGRDPAAPLQAVQRRLQRPLADLQHLARHLPNPLGDAPTVPRSQRQRLQEQQIEGALRQVQAVGCRSKCKTRVAGTSRDRPAPRPRSGSGSGRACRTKRWEGDAQRLRTGGLGDRGVVVLRGAARIGDRRTCTGRRGPLFRRSDAVRTLRCARARRRTAAGVG